MSIKSPYLLIVAVLTALMLGNLASFSRPSLSAEEKVAAATKSQAVPRASGALIVIEYEERNDVLRSGIIQQVPGLQRKAVLDISDPQTLVALEAMFPKYRHSPKSDLTGSWEKKYTIYFDFPDGKSIRFKVSGHSSEGASYSLGNGDHFAEGNIDVFVSQLLKKLSAGKR